MAGPIRNLSIRAEVYNGEVYINRDDVIAELQRAVPNTLSIMAVKFVSAFCHALGIALPDMGGEDHEKQD